MIMESFLISATDLDVLAAPSRLSAIPYNGQLIIEMQSENNDASNHMLLTVQLPDGSTPIAAQRISHGQTDGSISAIDKYVVAFNVVAGGHVLVQYTEVGSAQIDVRITLSP